MSDNVEQRFETDIHTYIHAYIHKYIYTYKQKANLYWPGFKT